MSAEISAPFLLKVAAELAESHRDRDKRPLPRSSSASFYTDLSRRIKALFDVLAQRESKDLLMLQGAEWLLDNNYLIQQALAQLRIDIPPSFYRQLPIVDDTERGQITRVEALIRKTIDAARLPLDLGSLEQFTSGYQSITPLKIGELWALPALLRAVILEQLCDSAERLFGRDDKTTVRALEAGDRVASCIVSLRTIEHFEWHEFVERTSRVDQILLRDPVGAYSLMDFETRDSYRDAVERIATHSTGEEWEVAESAVYLASTTPEEGSERRRHVGYFLIDDGRRELEELVGYSRSLAQATSGWLRRNAGPIYVISILATGLLLAGLMFRWLVDDMRPWAAVAMTLMAVPPLLMLCGGTINRIVTRLLAPRRLPKLDFTDGIRAPWKTIVAIPAMLSSTDDIDALLANLETNALGNWDRNLSYALLTDFVDAAEPEAAGDQALLDYIIKGVKQLNRVYVETGPSRFYLLHRRRLWNESESCWMGWERKRGKLEEFNQCLKGEEGTSFIRTIGDLDQFNKIRLVICLDADTHLPAGRAKKMVGTFAHPLNRPEFDAGTGRLIGGYTIIQPRVEINPTEANISRFSRIFTGDVTLDLYSRAVSNVYQDLLGEGIFVGKGIYDLDGFTRSLEAQLPENRILSHDLLEGIHGRAALASDIVLFEDYPPTVLAYARRQHRWIRGDWQLLPWLGWRAPRFKGRRTDFRPSLADRWKLFDNISRSLISPCLLGLLLLGWALLGTQAWASTLIVAALPGLPILFETFSALRRGTWRWGTIASTLAGKSQIIGDEITRWLLTLTFLPYQALLAADAILRTLFRVYVTRKHLLEWTSAAQVAKSYGSGMGLRNTVSQMSPVVFFAAVAGTFITLWSPASLPVAMPFLLAWFVSPLIAWWVGRPAYIPVEALGESEAKKLRLLARRTWHFFETFVGPENQWLPPDNVQQTPRLKVAQRTSPTNIGFALLSSIAACDFGYLAIHDLAARLRNSLQTLGEVPRYRGHFLNWISTSDLSPLEPRYISTVDSGNLVACLMALVQGLEELQTAPLPSPHLQSGIVDTVDVMQSQLDRIVTEADSPELDGVRRVLEDIRQHVCETNDRKSWQRALKLLETKECLRIEREALSAMERPSVHWSAEDIAEFRSWISSLRLQVHGARREVEEFLPWIGILAAKPDLYKDESTSEPILIAANELSDLLNSLLTLDQLVPICSQADSIVAQLDRLLEQQPAGAEVSSASEWNAQCRKSLHLATSSAQQLQADLNDLIGQATKIINWTDFSFLYDRSRELFHIGYNISAGELDSSYYDLLASEARLASYVAIAKQQVPPRHWVHLGRPLSRVGGMRVLLSWSATAFEYLMPRLLMACPDYSLLAQSCRTAIKQQQDFAGSHGIPWGISESGYYRFDQGGNYQYRAFGVPRLGLNRNQGDRLVVAPYASALALPFDPSVAILNLEALGQLGLEGQYGMREAVDYGTVSNFRGGRGDIVGSYMTHHQGMIMLALSNALFDDNMVRRFHADPRIASLEQLLYEAVPRPVPIQLLPPAAVSEEKATVRPKPVRTWSVDTARPAINLLSNGRLHVQLTGQGGGCQHWNDIALVAWDPVMGGLTGGFNLFFRDLGDGDFWSIGAEHARPGELRAEFGPHVAMFRHRRHDLLTRLTVAVATDADVEIRKLVITNESDAPRQLFIASAAEPVLTQDAEFRRHPAFSRLFIESKYIEENRVLIIRRRPRSSEERGIYIGHTIVVQPAYQAECYVENDRGAFLGRRGDPRRPQSLTGEAPKFTGTKETLNPQMSLGVTINVTAHATVQLAFLTAVAETQRGVLDTLTHFQSMDRVSWAISQAKAHSEHDLQQAKLKPEEARKATQLLAKIIWPDQGSMYRREAVNKCAGAQSTLWRHGVSGDRPIIVASIHSGENLHIATSLLKYHTYWSMRGVASDVVLIDESVPGYTQPNRDRLRSLIEKSEEYEGRFKGQWVVIPAGELHGNDRDNLVAVAAVYIGPEESDFDALIRRGREVSSLPPFIPVPSAPMLRQPIPPVPRPELLLFDNGFGGFSKDGREYVIYQTAQSEPPAPWANVIANPVFGCITTAAGLSCTWKGNSSEYRLTPWSNDPVTEDAGEALYLRDEETGLVWSPMPLPNNDGLPYKITHGQGYTRFEHNSNGLAQSVTVFVDPDDPVKIITVELTNTWSRVRRITMTYAAQWVLGNSHADNGGLLVADTDAETNAILVRNGFARNHGERTAFLAASEPPHGFTTDLDEFLGPNRSWRSPPALWSIGLSSSVSAGPDCGGAYQVHADLAHRETAKFHFLLGAGEDRSTAIELVRKFQDRRFVAERRAVLSRSWDDILGRIQIETPDLALDLITNRWLLYQVISSRLWGRTGFYQPGGAFGFRDQLQDVLALLWTAPATAREHILRAAKVQFEEGDVLHWWHPEPLRGVRTRCSDDLLWLPYVVAEYVAATGDYALLAETVPYLQGAPLEPDEHEHYAEFSPSSVRATIYEHCCHAIDARLTTGAHGLPFIGTGDWNDGLNRVGIGGAGESVWMAWFLYDVCHRFARVCDHQDDAERAEYYKSKSNELAAAADENAWDGRWYLRAFFDNGEGLGGDESNECRIDLNAQTWAGISQAAPAARVAQAMEAAEEHLIDPANQLIRLLTPPFDKTQQDPGYIKGYPPGIRENGSQYNHAATWAAWLQADKNCAEKAHKWSSWLNPINRSADRLAAERYQVEPYVLPGDICAGEENAGRGGWTWYTGSAAWYQRLIVEKLLGIVQEPGGFRVRPCVPDDWPRYVVTLTQGDTSYRCVIEEPSRYHEEGSEVIADDRLSDNDFIEWIDDGRLHHILIRPAQRSPRMQAEKTLSNPGTPKQ